MSELPIPNADESMTRLTELVLDHLAIPRAQRSKYINELQDVLLPQFIATARQALLAANPIPVPNDPTYEYLHRAMEEQPSQIRKLNEALEALGVHDLLEDVAALPDVGALESLPIDSYEKRLLRAAGHPTPETAVRAALHTAAKKPQFLAASEQTLEKAAQSVLNVHVHGNINIFIQQQPTNPPSGASATPIQPASNAPAKPKRRKLFSGLFKVFSGCVMLAGNAVVIPTVVIGNIQALPVLTSFAGGIAAVGDGVGQLVREGE